MEIHIDHRNVATPVSGADVISFRHEFSPFLREHRQCQTARSIVPLRVFGKNNSNLGKSRGVASQLKHVHIGVSTDGSADKSKERLSR